MVPDTVPSTGKNELDQGLVPQVPRALGEVSTCFIMQSTMEFPEGEGEIGPVVGRVRTQN